MEMCNIILHIMRWAFGGFFYGLLEILYRGYTDWSMVVLAMLLCIPLDIANNHIPWNFSLVLQSIIGGTVVTSAEFVVGIVLNMWFGLHIWDYSNMPCNLMGQVCLQFYILWIFIAGFAIVLFDYMDYWFCNGDKPRYKII